MYRGNCSDIETAYDFVPVLYSYDDDYNWRTGRWRSPLAVRLGFVLIALLVSAAAAYYHLRATRAEWAVDKTTRCAEELRARRSRRVLGCQLRGGC